MTVSIDGLIGARHGLFPHQGQVRYSTALSQPHASLLNGTGVRVLAPITNSASRDGERAMLMGAACAKASAWSPKKGCAVGRCFN